MHLLVILIIALLFFGPSKLADLGKGWEMESAISKTQ
jgi:Sec-independent protein translocase protein TatA